MSVSHHCIPIILFHTLLQSCNSISKSVLLSPSNPAQNGATVHILKDVTDYAPFEWDLHANDETDFNMKIHLSNAWSFDSRHTTLLSLQINSDSLTHISDTSLLVCFSQNNLKYITSVIQIGAINDDHLIYPPPLMNQKQNYGLGNIRQIVSNSENPNLDRISKATNNDSFGYFEPFTLNPNVSNPLIFTLQNNPNLDHLIFTYSNPFALPRTVLYYGMDTNQSFDLFISVGNIGDNFDISSFNITHHIISEFQSTENMINNSETDTGNIHWFKTSLVIVLVSSMAIMCCLCVLFVCVFCTMVTNHKKKIKNQININTPTPQSPVTENNMDISAPNMAQILDMSTPKSGDISGGFTDRMHVSNGGEFEQKKEMSESEEMYNGNNISIFYKQTSTIASSEAERDNNGELFEAKNRDMNMDLTLNLKDIMSGTSVAEGTVSPHASHRLSPSLQCVYESQTKQSSITPYAL